MIVAMFAILVACFISLYCIYKHENKKKDRNEIISQFLLCIIAAIIPTIVSICILNKETNADMIREARERHEEIRRVSIELISEVDPNTIVETVNLYKNFETSAARGKISAKYDRIGYCLTAFNLCTEAYYTEGDISRDAFINESNFLVQKYSDALDIIQYLISVPDEGVYYVPSLLKEAMINSEYNIEIISRIQFPAERMTRPEYGDFVAEAAVEILSFLGHPDPTESIQHQFLLHVGQYLRNDIKNIIKKK